MTSEESSVAVHARRYRRALAEEADNGTIQRAQQALVHAFRYDTVYIQKIGEGLNVPTVAAQGLTWIPVFSSPERLATWLYRRGEIGDGADADYVALPGSRLLDTYVPACPTGTGIVVDPGDDHVVALPPMQGIVPPSAALDAENVA